MGYYSLMETITISNFKATISEQLRKVRRGQSILISDRETPVALVSPVTAEPRIVVREPKAKYAPARPLPPIDHDPLEYLLEERAAR
jgi:prevent-host-death family protein